MSTYIPTLSLLAALVATQGLAAEENDAQSLYNDNCVHCHRTDELFTRDDRKVHSLAKLESQVRWCETNLGLRWFDDEVTAVAKLLNERFYHFKP